MDNYLLKANVETEKNAIHSKMMEQALADRSLFRDSVHGLCWSCNEISRVRVKRVDYTMAVMLTRRRGLNHGSPFNVVAGQHSADMNKLMQTHHRGEQAEGRRWAWREDSTWRRESQGHPMKEVSNAAREASSLS